VREGALVEGLYSPQTREKYMSAHRDELVREFRKFIEEERTRPAADKVARAAELERLVDRLEREFAGKKTAKWEELLGKGLKGVAVAKVLYEVMDRILERGKRGD
jgi:crotonobetainyl-CoA:carnitine CoA-transferase CaiB-like acyl-CoA transferase